MNTALAGSDPVVFFESQRLYDIGELFEPEVPADYYEIPMGPPAKRRSGSDLTMITVGATLYRALEAADQLQERHGMSCDVFDCRSINPLDYEPLVESVKRTGRVVLSSDACERGSIMQDIANNLSQLAFDYLDAPPWLSYLETGLLPEPRWRKISSHSQTGFSMQSMNELFH